MDYGSLIDSVYENDKHLEMYLKHIGENERGTSISLQSLLDAKAFYVPTEDYIIEHFGTKAREIQYDLYLPQNNEFCKYYQRLVIPIFNFMDEPIALCGWDKGNDYDTDDSFSKYVLSNKYVWDKKKFMYITRQQYQKAIEDGYILVTDGIFDTIKLRELGYNAVSLLGSKLSSVAIYMLRQIEHVIVVPDNDTAGALLEKTIKRKIARSVAIRQNKVNDIDEFLKTEDRILLFRNTFELMKKQNFRLTQQIPA